jgi:hypothetical protein
MLAMDSNDEPKVAVQPLVGTSLFIALQLREEAVWFSVRHDSTVQCRCLEAETTS